MSHDFKRVDMWKIEEFTSANNGIVIVVWTISCYKCEYFVGAVPNIDGLCFVYFCAYDILYEQNFVMVYVSCRYNGYILLSC